MVVAMDCNAGSMPACDHANEYLVPFALGLQEWATVKERDFKTTHTRHPHGAHRTRTQGTGLAQETRGIYTQGARTGHTPGTQGTSRARMTHARDAHRRHT